MLYSLYQARNWLLSDDCIVAYSDIFYTEAAIIPLLNKKSDISITYDPNWLDQWSKRFADPLEDAETFKSVNGKLTEIGGKTGDVSEIEAQYMGLLKITARGWDLLHQVFTSLTIKEQDEMDMTTMLNELLNREIDVHVVFVEGGWCESDNWSDITAYEAQLARDKMWIHNWL